jgi:DNA polymerase-3 subunit delta'
VRFDPLTEDDIRQALIERNGVEPMQAALAARLANGSYTDAMTLLSDEVLEERKHVLSFVRHALTGNAITISEDIDRIADVKDRTLTRRFLMLVLMWFRDALVLKNGGTIINVDQEEDLKNFVAKFPAADLLQVITEVEKAISLVERNVYIKILLLQLAVRIKANILNR